MRTRIVATTAIAAGLLVAVTPSIAAGATVRTDVACRVTSARGETFTVNGAGFTPGGTVTFTLNGSKLGDTTADVDGAVHVPIKLLPLRTGIGEARETLTLSDGVHTARAPSFGVTRFDASWTGVTSTQPDLARAKFEIFGFAGAGKVVYLHYVQPNGVLRTTVRLGTLGGPCGFLRTTQRKLFPFGSINTGFWRLQWDTSSAYHRVPSKPFIVRKIRVFLR